MDHLWIFGVPIFGAILFCVGAVLPFKTASDRSKDEGELQLVSDAAHPATLPPSQASHSLGRRLFLTLSRVALRNDRGIISEEVALEHEPQPSSLHDASPPVSVAAAQEFIGALEACNAVSGQTLADFGDAARAAHERDVQAIAREEPPPALAECERRWFTRLDPDLVAPGIEERMTLASWLAIPAPFAAKLLLQAFEEEDVPRVRARIIGALAGGEHFEAPYVFELAYAHGGIEKAAVWEVLAPRRDDLAWIANLLAR